MKTPMAHLFIINYASQMPDFLLGLTSLCAIVLSQNESQLVSILLTLYGQKYWDTYVCYIHGIVY